MRAGNTAAAERPGTAGFELERFEWTAPDRLEVAGRWFGVRGLRFMRPALDLHATEGRHRLLALLEHKPWAAEDGDEWVAAFPWEGDPVELTAAELAVGPNLAVELELPVVSGKPARGSKKTRARKSSSPARVRATRVRAGVSNDRAVAALREERDAALAARDAAGAARDVALAERDSARASRDAALAARDAVARERTPDYEAAVRDRDAAVAARSAALSELESVMAERSEAVAGRGAALRAREIAIDERDAARAAHDALLGERETAGGAERVAERRRREAAFRERDEANRDRDEAVRERDQVRRERDELQVRLDEALAQRALPARSATPPPWTSRAVALGALAIVLLWVAAAIIRVLI